jgi:hypothetical protein
LVNVVRSSDLASDEPKWMAECGKEFRDVPLDNESSSDI